MDTKDFYSLKDNITFFYDMATKELGLLLVHYQRNQQDKLTLHVETISNLDLFMSRIARQSLLSAMLFFMNDHNISMEAAVNAAKRVLLSELCNFQDGLNVAQKAMHDVRHKEAAILLDKFFSREMVKVP